MKRKHLVISILVLLLGAMGWLLMSYRDALEPTSSEEPLQANNKQQPIPIEPAGPLPEILRNTPAERQRRREAAEDRSLNEWRTPIEFYGKTVDENGQPVPDVTVTIGITDLSSDGHSTYRATSNEDGLFSLKGVTGKHLSISDMGKPGYYVSRRNPRSFFYAGQNENFVANERNPVLFHLRKQGHAEPLIAMSHPGFARIDKFPHDGTPVTFDLLNGKKSNAGGNHLRFEFACEKITREMNRYDWSLRIAMGGGLIETDEEFPFLAPETGYQSVVEIDMPVSLGEEWKPTLDKKYYFRLNNGFYGRIDLSLIARNGVFTLQSFVNPSGSRNLEYEEAAQAAMIDNH